MNKITEAYPDKAVYGLIGYPVNHSLSPDIFRFAFSGMNMNAEYRLWEVKEDELSDAVDRFRRLPVKGFNVTIPHKIAVIGHLDSIHERAQTIGAVNCVAKSNNILTGYNTDYAGVVNSLESFRKILQTASALVLGAGGAARAVVFALLTEFRTGPVFIANRSAEHAEKLIGDFKSFDADHRLRLLPAVKSVKDEATLLINCIPNGAFIEFISENLRLLNSVQFIFDLNYLINKKLIANQFQREIIYKDGLNMLVRQAAESFVIWTGKKMPEKAVLDYLRSEQKSQ